MGGKLLLLEMMALQLHIPQTPCTKEMMNIHHRCLPLSTIWHLLIMEKLYSVACSSSRYIVQNGKSSIQGTYETSQNAQGATVNLDIASSLEQIAHELFHCFQIDMGQPIKTINSEVEAYIYAYGIAMTSFLNQGSEMSPMTPLSGMERGSSSYNDAVDALLWSTQFDSNLFQIVVSGFLQNSNANLYGVYDG